jgi:putative glutamine amidotransferase
MRRPDDVVIGIPAVHEPARWSVWSQPAHLVADTYVSSVRRSGAAALLLPVDERAVDQYLDRVDGLLLIGGSDIDPSFYGAERDPRLEATFPERDQFEISLVHAALARELPALGICRGMQVINVALGGTLCQHLLDGAGQTSHRRNRGSFAGTEHEVELQEGSLAAQAVGELRHIARCHHHQGVDRLGQGLVVSARSHDGVAEALEAADGRWLLGLAWHPEADPRSRVFSALTDAASARRDRGDPRPGGEAVHAGRDRGDPRPGGEAVHAGRDRGDPRPGGEAVHAAT